MKTGNKLALTVINDNDGSICGMTYARRCEVVGYNPSYALIEYLTACRKAADWIARHSDDAPRRRPMREVLAAAREVREYYLNHVAAISRAEEGTQS